MGCHYLWILDRRNSLIKIDPWGKILNRIVTIENFKDYAFIKKNTPLHTRGRPKPITKLFLKSMLSLTVAVAATVLYFDNQVKWQSFMCTCRIGIKPCYSFSSFTRIFLCEARMYTVKNTSILFIKKGGGRNNEVNQHVLTYKRGNNFLYEKFNLKYNFSLLFLYCFDTSFSWIFFRFCFSTYRIRSV